MLLLDCLHTYRKVQHRRLYLCCTNDVPQCLRPREQQWCHVSLQTCTDHIEDSQAPFRDPPLDLLLKGSNWSTFKTFPQNLGAGHSNLYFTPAKSLGHCSVFSHLQTRAAQTYLHVMVSVSWTGITRSPVMLSRVGGGIEKPITRPEGGNTATALDSCYAGQSRPSAFDRTAGKLSNLTNTSGVWNQTQQRLR